MLQRKPRETLQELRIVKIGKFAIDQFLNCLNENLKFLKDLKPVDPDNINEATLFSNELVHDNEKILHFDLLQNASGTRSLKITKNQPGFEPPIREINIPEDKLEIVEKRIQKVVSAIKKNNQQSEPSEVKKEQDKVIMEKPNLEKSNKPKNNAYQLTQTKLLGEILKLKFQKCQRFLKWIGHSIDMLCSKFTKMPTQ